MIPIDTFPHRLLLILALVAAAGGARVRAQGYKLELDAAPYTDLNGERLSLSYDGGFNRADLPITGETFSFFGETFTLGQSAGFTIMNTGGVSIGGVSISTLIYAGGAVLGAGSNGYRYHAIDSTSSVSYRVDGDPGARIVKLQWRAAGVGAGTDTGHVNVQLWIYQGTGVVELRYGPRVIPAIPDGKGFGVGIELLSSQEPYIRQKFWMAGDADHPSVDLDVDAQQISLLDGLPAEGSIIRFVPTGTAGTPRVEAESPVAAVPSPARDRITITGDVAGSTARLYDLRGDLLATQRLERGRESIDISRLPVGLYMLRLAMKDGQRTIPIVKE